MIPQLISDEDAKWLTRILTVVGVLSVIGAYEVLKLIYHLVVKGGTP